MDTALSAARAARRLEPWAASPRLQLALVLEQDGDLDAARGQIQSAVERDPEDWRLWLVKSRLETKAGAPAVAAASYSRARALNPRSPLFATP
jgi:Tfp pilus assembly protein PilF